MSAALSTRQWTAIADIVDEGISGSTPLESRSALAAALDLLDNGGADVLVVAKLDRLSRSMVDFASVMERARTGGWAIVALDIGVDSTSPSGELVANLLASVAHHERRLISERTRDALAVLKRSGVRLGRPLELEQSTRERILKLRNSGESLRAICARLEAEGISTARGGKWYPATVRGVLASLDRDARSSTCHPLMRSACLIHDEQPHPNSLSGQRKDTT
jgi:DNA invertase Pin-like site-specific DNA recombinase